MGQLSLQSYDWKYRLGTQKKWKDKPPQAQIKSLYPETEEKWKKDRDKKIDLIERRNIKREEKTKLIKKEKEAYKKRVEQHKKSAKYLDIGDYNSQVNGINGDWKFRCENVFAHYGHLYGRNTGEGTGDIARPFCPKHMLRLLNFLIMKGILV
jgi:1,2-phenylacetyl-CoA epoxidase catalytic subunit